MYRNNKTFKGNDPMFDYNMEGGDWADWSNPTPNLPMNWHKALLVLIPIAAVLNFLIGIGWLAFTTYFVVKNGFDWTFPIAFICVVLAPIATAITGIIAEFKLKDHKSDGPVWLYVFLAVMYGAGISFGIVMCVGGELMTGACGIASSLVIGIVVIFLNMRYFNRRAAMFVK